MKIYVFEGEELILARYASPSIDEAIAWFKETYPHRRYISVYEQ